MKNNSKTKELKCNFCLQNFGSSLDAESCSIKLCQLCFSKALETSNFKTLSPHGDMYQIFLARKINQHSRSSQKGVDQGRSELLAQIETLQQVELKNSIGKWMQIGYSVQTYKDMTEGKIATLKQILEADKSKQYQLQLDLALQLQQELTVESQKKISFESNEDQNILRSLPNGNQKLKTQQSLEDIDLDKIGQNRISMFAKGKTRRNKNQSLMKENFRGKINTVDINLPTTEQFYYPPGLWNWTKGPTIFMGYRHANKSENCLQSQKCQFWNKMHSLKSRILHYLQKQNKISPVLYKLVTESTCEAVQTTNKLQKCLQLVSYKLEGVDFGCYLEMLEWQEVEIVKFVKVNLNDEQGKVLLNFIAQNNLGIKSLALTSNKLSEQFVKDLASTDIVSLKNIYLGKNQIQSSKARKEIKDLKEKYNLYL